MSGMQQKIYLLLVEISIITVFLEISMSVLEGSRQENVIEKKEIKLHFCSKNLSI